MREVLEGAVAPELATQIMFEALDVVGRVPSSSEEVMSFCRGPLRSGVASRLGDDIAAIILERLEQVLTTGDRTGTDIPIDIDFDDAEPSVTAVMTTVWRQPVSVLVLASTKDFAERLFAALGATRVTVRTVATEAEIQKGIFSAAPLLVLVDATAPPNLARGVVATSFRALPDNALPVVWGRETEYGEGLAVALEAAGIGTSNSLRFSDGIGPLLDLVLSRSQED